MQKLISYLRKMEKKNLIALGVFGGIMIFFIGLASFIALGPATTEEPIAYKISTTIKLAGMGLLCMSLIGGGVTVDELDKDVRNLMMIFGTVILLISIAMLSVARGY